jgi:hypothetical protein
VVLFVCLDEGGHDLFDRADSGVLADLIKSVLDDLGISHILVEKSLFLFV